MAKSSLGPTTFTLRYNERPNFGMNKERTVHHMVRAKITKEWRAAFSEIAQMEMMPRLVAVKIVVQPYLLSGRYRQDVCFGLAPLAKAAIDGIVDAGVLLDDNSNIVRELTFRAPIYGCDALELAITEVDPDY